MSYCGFSDYDSQPPDDRPSSADRVVLAKDHVPPVTGLSGIGQRLRSTGRPRAAFSQTMGQWKRHYRNLRLQRRAWREPYYRLALIGILAMALGILVIVLVFGPQPGRSIP